ncbi:ankyrin repeat-containing protein BDA1-like [Herrania umbratica]|uniref:Ankyrin repeat-containing protein BDA1-like n=1 Tax=Herrania umbratica TaxID=108875 RepID=A0A6J1BGY8_9ROSI|nr:ankyrin repeat-containing protein BDA1-like [Herrania umbratica]
MGDRLTAASKAGDVTALYELIEEDADFLRRVEEIMFVHTPLHIAASDGQTCFAMEMINLMPSFSRKLNKSGFSPMHLALLNGHSKLLLLFLRADCDLVRVKGRGGMTSLHYACTKHGNDDVLANFLVACPKSIEDLTAQGETALHIAVKSNNLGALEVLVRWLRRVCHVEAFNWEINIPNWKDENGHTILDIAVSNNMQLEASSLLYVLKLLAEINAKTSDSLTVSDILRRRQSNLGRNRVLRTQCGTTDPEQNASTLASYLRSKLSFDERLAVYITRHKMKISDDVRNILLVVAGFITASTLQIVVNDPGGFQRDVGDSGNNNSEATPVPSQSHLSDRAAMTVFLLSSLYNNTAFCIVNGVIGLLLPDGLFGMILIRLLPVSILCYVLWIQRSLPNGLVIYNLLVFLLAYVFVFLAFVTYSRGQNKLRQLQSNTNNIACSYRKRKTEAAEGQANSATSADLDP